MLWKDSTISFPPCIRRLQTWRTELPEGFLLQSRLSRVSFPTFSHKHEPLQTRLCFSMVITWSFSLLKSPDLSNSKPPILQQKPVLLESTISFLDFLPLQVESPFLCFLFLFSATSRFPTSTSPALTCPFPFPFPVFSRS